MHETDQQHGCDDGLLRCSVPWMNTSVFGHFRDETPASQHQVQSYGLIQRLNLFSVGMGRQSDALSSQSSLWPQ
jgi:hypothetical protein